MASPAPWCAAALCSALTAQTTWIVRAGGGPGVDFTDLPTAVAAAADGDTIIVQTGPFGEGAVGFTTSKGLTIVGQGGVVPITTSPANPIRIVNLPPASAFRMVGFSRSTDGELNFDIDHCAGLVHLDRIVCREPDVVFPTGPATTITHSASVTLREFATFGAPAIDVVDSTVALVRCQLGLTYAGLGGGQCLRATGSTIEIGEPRFDTGFGASNAIEPTNSTLRIGGSAAAYVRNPGGDVVVTSGGVVVRDPGLPLMPGGGFSAVTGSAAVVQQIVPVTWTSHAYLGAGLMQIATTAPVGTFVVHVLGVPGALLPSPLGTLGIDASQPYSFLQVALAVPTTASSLLALPSVQLQGLALTVQGVLLSPTLFELSMPCTFVVH